MSKPYTISVGFTTSYDDKNASASLRVTDSDGLYANSSKSGTVDDTDEMFEDLFKDITKQVISRSKSEPALEDMTNAQLIEKIKKLQAEKDALAKDHAKATDENKSLKIDSNVLKMRNDKLQKAYDSVVSKCSAEEAKKNANNVGLDYLVYNGGGKKPASKVDANNYCVYQNTESKPAVNKVDKKASKPNESKKSSYETYTDTINRVWKMLDRF